MVLLERIDEFGKPAWIALTILAFWLAWPIGIVMLVFLAYSGRFFRGWMACQSGQASGSRGRWYYAPHDGGGDARGPSGGNRASGGNPWGRSGGCGGWHRRPRHAQSGNAAFDEYRAETLRRLEEEQREFFEYLERLRRARDKEEFDRFMAERRNRPPVPEASA